MRLSKLSKSVNAVLEACSRWWRCQIPSRLSSILYGVCRRLGVPWRYWAMGLDLRPRSVNKESASSGEESHEKFRYWIRSRPTFLSLFKTSLKDFHTILRLRNETRAAREFFLSSVTKEITQKGIGRRLWGFPSVFWSWTLPDLPVYSTPVWNLHSLPKFWSLT